MCHGIFPLYSPKPTSFWCLGSLNQAAHPATDQNMSVWTDWLKMGPSGSGKGVTMPWARPRLGCRPSTLLRPVGSWLGLCSIPGMCWPICTRWFGFLSIFFLLCFGSNVILCFFYSCGPFVVYFHINPAKQVKHQNLWNILVEIPIY
jgi:hypothetical protein